ncbi:hypothetical protein UY3_02865 [Chelonia mydas]|uniref:Uncharacterized protein n=1 Tax=Chelonia mydas TaxID=8469 RepID=M7BRS1_CHEMY|nr:hypothetical protein UY3_02865 [Chelonia mydas]
MWSPPGGPKPLRKQTTKSQLNETNTAVTLKPVIMQGTAFSRMEWKSINCMKKLVQIQTDIIFLSKCKQMDIVPKGLKRIKQLLPPYDSGQFRGDGRGGILSVIIAKHSNRKCEEMGVGIEAASSEYKYYRGGELRCKCFYAPPIISIPEVITD